MQYVIEEILNALISLSRERYNKPSSLWIKRYGGKEEMTINQFAVFLKPEATAILDDVNVEEILHLVLHALACYAVEFGAVRICSSDYLKSYRIIDRHYGVINRVSRYGIEALSSEAKNTLENVFAGDVHSEVEILGGHQFLERYPVFSAQELGAISDTLSPKKLAAGTYCIRFEWSGKVFLLLNSFHPFQLEKYTAKGKSIIVFEGRSHTPWRVLRQQLLGATDPNRAAEGSIRRSLLQQQRDLGLAEVNMSNNGLHLSAGPLEGMVELQTFFSDFEEGMQLDLQKTCFGQLVLSKAHHEQLLSKLAANPLLKISGRPASAFDLTEEMDSEAAARKLVDVYEDLYSVAAGSRDE